MWRTVAPAIKVSDTTSQPNGHSGTTPEPYTRLQAQILPKKASYSIDYR